MPSNISLKERLKGKPLKVQGAWCRVLSYIRIQGGGPTPDSLETARRRCRDYLLEVDDGLFGCLQQYHNREAWRNDLADLKNAVVDGILSRVANVRWLGEVSGEEIVEWSQALGAVLAGDLKTSQVRRFFGAVTQAELDVKMSSPGKLPKDRFVYLKVYLAYASGRHPEVRPLLAVVEPMIDRIRRQGADGWQDDFQVLVQFVRSVVAYHKFYGGD